MKIILIIAAVMIILIAVMIFSSGGKKSAQPADESDQNTQEAANRPEKKWSFAVYHTGMEKAYGNLNQSMLSPISGPEPRIMIGDDSVYELPRLSNKATVFSNPSARTLLSLRKHLILTAPGGYGKSTLMRYIFLTAASSFMRHRSEEIPVYLEAEQLRAIAVSGANPADMIHSRLQSLGVDVSREQLDHDLNYTPFLILLDGFDELTSMETVTVIENLKAFHTGHPDMTYFAAARPDYENKPSGFFPLEIMPFSQGEAVRLSKKLIAAKKPDSDFPRRLRDDFYDNYPAFTENPLLLSLFCVAYLASGAKPDRPAVFFDTAFDAVTGEQDWKKFHSHETVSREDFKRITACFCQQTYFLEQDAFGALELPSILERAVREARAHSNSNSGANYHNINPENILKDLRDYAFVLVRDGTRYKFIHPGFQVAFAALYDIRELPQERRKERFRALISDPSWEKRMEYYEMLYQLEPERFGSELLRDYIQDLLNRIENGTEDPDAAYLKAMSKFIPWEYDSIRDLVVPRANRGYGPYIYDAAASALFQKHILGTGFSNRRENFNWQTVDPIFERLPDLSTYEEVDVQLTAAERRVFYHAAVQSERVPAIREAMRKWLDGLKDKK